MVALSSSAGARPARARRELRRLARIAGFGAQTCALLPSVVAQEAVSHHEQRDSERDRWVKLWSAAVLRIFGVTVLSHGTPPPRARGRLVVSNHRSTADILVLLRTFGGHMVSRADLARWPLVGHAARAVRTVFVDRTDAVSGATAVRVIRSQLARGATIIVFPEGTTFAEDEVRPFHPGAFVAALHTGADVLPVGLAYASGSGAAFVDESFPAHLARMAAAPPSRMAICIGDPIAVGDNEPDTSRLVAALHLRAGNRR